MDNISDEGWTEATLGDFQPTTTSQVVEFLVLRGENLGYPTLKASLPLRLFIDISQVANQATIEGDKRFNSEYRAQREYNANHARGLAQYTLEGLSRQCAGEIKREGKKLDPKVQRILSEMRDPPYACLQPMVVNIRRCEPGGRDLVIKSLTGDPGLEVMKLCLGDEILWVVDGQHRRSGFDMVIQFLDHVIGKHAYPDKKGSLFVPSDYVVGGILPDPVVRFWEQVKLKTLQHCSISLEIHLGLKEKQERQLFHDLNNLQKRPPVGTNLEFDNTDVVNRFVKAELVNEGVLPFRPTYKDQTDWHADDGALLHKDINTITAFLLHGKPSTKSCSPLDVKNHQDFAIKFWEVISAIPGFGKKGAKAKTIASQPVVLKALAKLAYDLAYGPMAGRDEKALKKLFDAIRNKKIDFGHSEPLWRALFKNDEDRKSEFPGVEKYVFVPSGTNLDAGTFSEPDGWVRFGSRHNDIFPRIGDLIRFKLGIPARRTVANAIAKRDKAESAD